MLGRSNLTFPYFYLTEVAIPLTHTYLHNKKLSHPDSLQLSELAQASL